VHLLARSRAHGRADGSTAGDVPCARTALRRFAVSVAPLRVARGVQNKALEAMAAGCPVVMTSVVSTGLLLRDGRDAIVADCPAAIAHAVLRLLWNPAERRRIGLHAREYVARHHLWPRNLSRP
jgi:glycosyltransferase involved in cell wall biosynthesis